LIRTALLALISCVTTFGQNSAPTGISGSVINSVTRDPIVRAHVTLRNGYSGDPREAQTWGAVTNAEGKFSISGLPPGSYRATAEKTGFVAPGPGGSITLTEVTLAEDDRKPDLQLSLTPAGAIEGRVLDAHGDPVYHASVNAEMGGYSSSDEQGRYRIGGLAPGRYRIRVTPEMLPFEPEIRTDGTRPAHYSQTYYPDSIERSAATRLEVRPGATVGGVDIHLAKTPWVVVSGVVTGIPAGAQGAAIRPLRRDEAGYGGFLEVRAKADGSFAIAGLDAGRYTLIATAIGAGRLPNIQIAQTEIDVAGANIEHLELHGVAPFEVRGQIRFEDEKLRKPQSGTARRIYLRAADRGGGHNADSEIAVDDTFGWRDVPAARYRVTLASSGGYVRSIRAGSVETEGNMLDLTHGPPGPLTVSMSSVTCEVSGTVSDANGPVAKAWVLLVTDEMGTQLALTKEDGSYTFQGLAPGKYSLAASAESFSRQPMGNPLEDYQDVAVNLELQAGDKITRDLKRK
jgi:hypothetical protein